MRIGATSRTQVNRSRGPMPETARRIDRRHQQDGGLARRIGRDRAQPAYVESRAGLLP